MVLWFMFHHAAALTWKETIFPIFPALFPEADIMQWGCFFFCRRLPLLDRCYLVWRKDWEVGFTKQTPIHSFKPQRVLVGSFINFIHTFLI